MEIETKIISIEFIKPSSPTPKSLQKHQLSFLDQIAPPFIMPFVYFYSSNPIIPNSQKSIHLKKSFSETLSRFYPLAGCLVDSLYVDCNDSGTPFAKAEANCNLTQVITNPDPKTMKMFLPYKLYETLDVCMATQATYLRCGGLAIGILISHKIADAFSFVLFANTWSAVAKYGDSGDIPIPKFNAAAYFPPLDISGFKPTTGMLKEELATRIFTFPASKIAVIRERYSAAADQLHRRPTRVEALLAFIWTRLVSALGMKADPNKILSVQQPVNLRSRVDPMKSEFRFGNIFRLQMTEPAVGDDAVELLRKFREAKGSASSDDDMAGLEEGEKYLKLMKERMAGAITGELVSFSFTSLCRFPLYEADFGWGKPVWVGLAGFPFKNLVIFKDTKNGDGIEALIHLRKTDMEKFEADLELQQLKSNL